LLAAANELRPKIKAGVLVSDRRWDLVMTNGMIVRLPEVNPQAAMATLVRLQREDRVLERAALSLDLRVAGKMFVRLTEEAAAARAAAHPAKKGAT
jgi:cell division protein FtsQ